MASRSHNCQLVAGASVLFPSGPKAKGHLSDVSGIEFAGPGDNGFDTYRIKL